MENQTEKSAPLTPYGEDGFKEAKVVVKRDGSLVIVPMENQSNSSDT